MKYPKPKKVKKSTLKNKADKLFSEKIRAIGVCQLKGLDKVKCSGQLQTMHIFGRANYRLRWEEQNALCGCSGHHFYYTNNPTSFGILLAEKFSMRLDYLKAIRNEMWDKEYDKVFKSLQE